MNYATDNDGNAMLRMTPDENLRFQQGEEIVIRNGDSQGTFTIRAKLTRPRSRATRYPVDVYGKDYQAPTLTELEASRTSKMRAAAESILAEHDFGFYTLEGSAGWEYDTSTPNTIIRTIFLKREDRTDTVRYRFQVSFEDFESPGIQVYREG